MRASAPGLLLVALAFADRVLGLTRQSLWPDELYNVEVSQWTLGATWANLVGDHVPLFTVVLGAWRAVAGASEFSLRFLSVVFATLVVALAIALARRLLNPAPGYAAGFLLAISPFQIYYAQEVVTYSLLGAMGLLSSWIFLRWMARPSRWILLTQSLLYATMAYTHYSGLFVPVTHGVIALTSRIARRLDPGKTSEESRIPMPTVARSWILSWSAGVILFLPWALTHLGSATANVAGGTSKTVAQLVNLTLVDLSFGYAVETHLDGGDPIDALVLRHLAWAALLLPLCFALVLLSLRKGQPLAMSWGHIVPILHVLVPYGLLFILVQATREFASRYGFPATPWFPIAAAAGLWSLRAPLRGLGVSVLVGYSLWGSLIYFGHPGFARLDFRAAVSDILDHRQTGDAVLVTAPYVASTFDYYSQAAGVYLPRAPLPSTIPPDEPRTQSTVAALGAGTPRLWHLRWQDYYADPHGVIGRWLADHAIRESQRDFGGGLTVDLWLTRPPILDGLPREATAHDGQLGNVRLLGYTMDRTWPDTLTATFYWRLVAPAADDDTLFIHVLTPDGQRLAQGDAQPYGGQFPTTRWPVGPVIRDVHVVPVDPCLVGGHYDIAVGFYVLRTMRRLGDPGHDTLLLPLDLATSPHTAGLSPWLRLLPSALRLDNHQPGGTACVSRATI